MNERESGISLTTDKKIAKIRTRLQLFSFDRFSYVHVFYRGFLKRQPATSVRNITYDKKLESSTDSKQTNDDVNRIVIDSSSCNIATNYIILKIRHVIALPACVWR